MTPAGWFIMLSSVGSVSAVTFYCLFRVLMLPPEEVAEHLKAPLDIDTHDTTDVD